MNQELKTTEILQLFQTDKQQREDFALSVINAIEQGEVSALKIKLQLKSAEDLISKIESNTIYKKSVLAEAEQQGEKSFGYFNAKFEVKEVGVKYDYSQCNDPVLERLTNQLNEISDKVKQRQKLLQTAPQKGLTLVDEETGEAITIYPPSKSSTTSVAVTLK